MRRRGLRLPNGPRGLFAVEEEMKAAELRNKTTEELQSELQSLKENLFNQRFRSILGQLEDTTRIGKVRKDIARVQTVLRARASGLEGQGE